MREFWLRGFRLLLDGHEDQRPAHVGDGVGVPVVDGFEPHPEWKVEVHAVAGLPFAADRGELSRYGQSFLPRPIDGDGRALCPGRNAEVHSQGSGPRACHREGDMIFKGVLTFLWRNAGSGEAVKLDRGTWFGIGVQQVESALGHSPVSPIAYLWFADHHRRLAASACGDAPAPRFVKFAVVDGAPVVGLERIKAAMFGKLSL